MQLSELINCESVKKIEHGWIYAVYTDHTEIGVWPDDFDGEVDIEFLLEIRVFDEYREFRASRMDIGEKLLVREIDDTEVVREFFDEYQYINRFDRKLIHKNQLVIRNYIDYETESGQAYIVEWRMLGFK